MPGTPEIELPATGSVAGLGEGFDADPFTGTGRFAIGLELPTGRNGFGPTLTLTYSSGNPNGPFGMGWRLSVPAITRSTRHAVAAYDGSDVFVWDGGEDLVPVDGGTPTRLRYRPRVEEAFARIEHVTEGGSDHWEVRTGDGHVHTYGTVRPADAAADWQDPGVLADPAARGHIAAWSLTESRDACGSVVRYGYERDGEQLYLSTID